MSSLSSVSGKRGGKSKVPLPASSSLFALGGNATPSSSSSSGSNVGKIGIKRDGPLNRDALIAAKRPKVLLGSNKVERQYEEWEDAAIEVESELLIKRIIEAEGGPNEGKIEGYLCGAVKQLRANKLKPESVLYLSLMYLAKTRPQHFCNDTVIEALCSLLRRDSSPASSLKTPKSTNQVSILAANLLLAAHQDENCWHLSFIKAYIEDSLGDRVWVDSDACKGFVDNILTAFNTKTPPKNLMSQDVLSSAGNAIGGNKGTTNESPASTSPSHNIVDDSLDETSSSSLFSAEFKERLGEEVTVVPRYAHNQQTVTDYVVDVINEQLNRRQVPSEINRNVLKLLISTAGIPQIRLLVAQKLEIWLQNPKLSRPAQDLLLAICVNCTEDDCDVISALVKMRLKTKPLMNHFVLCVKELLSQNDSNIMTVMRNAMSNELSSTRGSNNMQLFSVMFQYSSGKATKCFAYLIQEFLIKDDFLRPIRTLLREIVRTLRHDHINLTKLVETLTQDNARFAGIDSPEILSRILTSIADIIVLCMFLTISPTVKESISKPEKKEFLKQYQGQIAEMQRLSIIWVQEDVMKVYKPERSEFMHCLNKCLFMESVEHYYNKDNWPPENEREFMFRLTTKAPLHEESIMRILKMALSKDYPVQSPDAIELSDALIKRAAALFDGDLTSPTLPFKKEKVFKLLLENSKYRIPENITLPAEYQAPEMAISDWYWKIWIQLLIIVAHNSTKFGAMALKDYPILVLLIEMCITNHFEYPPPTRQGEDIKSHELQITAIEKQQILQFESHLAAASSKRQITESNSLLLSKLITYDPHGKPRQPPQSVLEQLKSFNGGLRLGYLLCQSREPDFLLEIIKRQQKQSLMGPNISLGLGSMQWLNDLIELNCENFSTLPVQCLGEFTLRYVNDEEQLIHTFNELRQNEKNKRKEKRRRFCKLLAYFKNALNKDIILAEQLMKYFMTRLYSNQSSSRSLASKSLNLILCFDESMIENFPKFLKSNIETWLLGKLPTTANFQAVTNYACECLRSAILVETDPESVCCYIQFLAEYGIPGDKKTLLDVSRLVIDRAVIFKFITKDCHLRDDFLCSCIKLYYDFMGCIERQEGNLLPEGNPLDHILVEWPNYSVVLHILIVHALIVLLTFEPPAIAIEQYEKLVNYWFSDPIPSSYLVGTSEEALLLPDWLKLKLIRSSSPILIQAALRDLEIPQLLLFIQSFGIPVHSMEKILQALDYACEVDPDTVRNSIVDLHFMQQIVEVQFMRGVKAGQKFAQLIALDMSLCEANVKKNDELDPFLQMIHSC